VYLLHTKCHPFATKYYFREQEQNVDPEHAVNGHAVNGHAVNGHAVNGHAVNEHAVNGMLTPEHAVIGFDALAV